MKGFLKNFRDRKLAQWAVAYSAGAWVVYEATGTALEAWAIPVRLVQAIHLLLLFGFLITLILAWYHGEKGRQRISGLELVLLAMVLLVAGGAISLLDPVGSRVSSGSPQQSDMRSDTESEPSIAVLPWEIEGGRAEDEYLAEHAHRDLIDRLSDLENLVVRPRASVMRFSTSAPEPRRIAEELDVRYLLPGRLVRIGDTVSIGLDLIDVERDAQVWGHTFHRLLSSENIREVQTALTREVAAAIGATLTEEEGLGLGDRGTTNTDASLAYLNGRFHWNRRTEEGLRIALGYFRAAIELDPSYAEAHAGIADSHAMLMGYNIVPVWEACPEATQAANEAIELNSELAAPHTSLGFILPVCDHDWTGAIRHFRRALALESDYPTAHHWFAWILAAQRRFDEANRRMDRAQELNPLSPIIGSAAGWILAASGSFDRAEEQFGRVFEMDPDFPRAHLWFGTTLALRGRFDEGLTHLRKAVDLTGRNPQYLSGLAFGLGRSGDLAGARTLLQELKERSTSEFIAPYDMALSELATGADDGALRELERGLTEGDFWVALVALDPRFNDLRRSPVFQNLLRDLGLAGVVY